MLKGEPHVASRNVFANGIKMQSGQLLGDNQGIVIESEQQKKQWINKRSEIYTKEATELHV